MSMPDDLTMDSSFPPRMSWDPVHRPVGNTITPNVSPLPSEAPREVATGSAYFTTLAHYQSVARRILIALSGGGRFVLLTGSPPPNGRLLSGALSKEAAGKHAVIGVPCGRHVTRDDWRRLAPGRSGNLGTEAFSATALLVTLGSPLPLYVLEEADHLSDEQLQEFFAAWLFGEPTIGTAVLTVSPTFLARLERPALSFLIEGLAARMLFQHLGPDEIATFVRQQQREDMVETTFSADSIAAIAAASGGDPGLVNRLVSRTVEEHQRTHTRVLQKMEAPPALPTLQFPPPDLNAKTAPVIPQLDAAPASPAPALQNTTHQASPPEPPARRRHGMRRRLLIGTSVVFAYFVVLLVLGSFIPRYFRPMDDAPLITELRPADLLSKTLAASLPDSETTPLAAQAAPSPPDGDSAESVISQPQAVDAAEDPSSKPASTVTPLMAPVPASDQAQNNGQTAVPFVANTIGRTSQVAPADPGDLKAAFQRFLDEGLQADNGPGMTQAQKDELFGQFQRWQASQIQ
jgi:hypothetical protein